MVHKVLKAGWMNLGTSTATVGKKRKHKRQQTIGCSVPIATIRELLNLGGIKYPQKGKKRELIGILDLNLRFLKQYLGEQKVETLLREKEEKKEKERRKKAKELKRKEANEKEFRDHSLRILGSLVLEQGKVLRVHLRVVCDYWGHPTDGAFGGETFMMSTEIPMTLLDVDFKTKSITLCFQNDKNLCIYHRGLWSGNVSTELLIPQCTPLLANEKIVLLQFGNLFWLGEKAWKWKDNPGNNIDFSFHYPDCLERTKPFFMVRKLKGSESEWAKLDGVYSKQFCLF